MTSFGAKIYTAFIKNPAKKRFVYRMLVDSGSVNALSGQYDKVEQMLYYVHNYLAKPQLAIVCLSGGLGNQMHLYAFGRALQARGHNVVFDARHYAKADIQQ